MGSQVRVHIERHDGSEGRTGNWHRSGSVRATTKNPFAYQWGNLPAPVTYICEMVCQFHMSLPRHPLRHRIPQPGWFAARAEADAGHYSPRRGSRWCESTGRCAHGDCHSVSSARRLTRGDRETRGTWISAADQAPQNWRRRKCDGTTATGSASGWGDQCGRFIASARESGV